MARAARAALADARALEEQNLRQQMHGGAFYGAGMRVGGGATPSMGLSQFRGGKHCNMCGQSDCNCESSDEEMEGGGMSLENKPSGKALEDHYRKMVDAFSKPGPSGKIDEAHLAGLKKALAAVVAENKRIADEAARKAASAAALRRPGPAPPVRRGGAGLGSLARTALNEAAIFGRFGRFATAAERAEAARRFAALTAENQRAVEAASAALRSGRTAIVNAPSSALALRGAPSTAISTIPGNRGLPFDASLDVRGLSGPARASVASRLSAMGVTPARLAAALAAGVAVGSLESYFQNQGAQAPGAGDYDVYGAPGAGAPGAPITPFTPPPGPDAGPGGRPVPEDLVPNVPKKVLAAYLRSGNAPARFRRGNEAQKLALAMAEGAVTGGRRKREKKPMKEGDGRRVRAQAVKAIMAKHGLSLPAASKYLKEHGSA